VILGGGTGGTMMANRLRRLTSPVYQPFNVQPPPSNLSVLWTLWRAARNEPFRS